MDISIVASLLLLAVGAKFAVNAIRLFRSKEVRASEDKLVFYKKVAPLSKSDSRRFVFAVGIASYCLAAVRYVSPTHPPFTSRHWGWLDSFVFQELGSNGMVLLSVIVGTALLFAAARRPRL